MSVGEEDSARSHAMAGMWYVGCGGAICTVALLLIRYGITSIFWDPGKFLLPVEFIAGIAAIVVFMGLIQLVIAFILKLRGRH
jgi:hypothetical protein